MKCFSTILFLIMTTATFAQKNYVFIGTYTNGKSEGIYVYDFNSVTGDSKLINIAKSSNPSFLAVSPNKKTLYAVNENADTINNGGSVAAFSISKKSGRLRFINQQLSGGNHPCYVTCNKTSQWVLVGNYSSGTISVLPIGKRGSLVAASQIIQHKGKGPNQQRQEKAHVHATVLSNDNQFCLVPDLGIDKIMLYHFDAGKGLLTPTTDSFLQVQPGAGPRHMAFHPSHKYVYLTEELSGTVAAFKYDSMNGKLKLLQTISAVAENYKGSFSGADIHVSADGKFLYASNRGDANTIAIFSIDETSGVLTAVGQQSTLGIKPRNFSIDPSGKFLLVANQDSDNIVIFKRNEQTGLLEDSGKKIEVPAPVCIKWLNE